MNGITCTVRYRIRFDAVSIGEKPFMLIMAYLAGAEIKNIYSEINEKMMVELTSCQWGKLQKFCEANSISTDYSNLLTFPRGN